MNLLNYQITNNLLQYLESKKYDKQILLEKIEQTNFYLYEENTMLDVSYEFLGKKIPKSIITDSKSYGFTTALLMKHNMNIFIAKRIVAINQKYVDKNFDIILLHELLHLLSQNNIEKECNKFIYRTGICENKYDIFTKEDSTYPFSRVNLNEGITQFLAEEIYKKIYRKESGLKKDYSCVFAVEILNAFLDLEDLDFWLDIYLNNKYDYLIEVISSRLNISESFLMNLNIGIKYTERRKKDLNKLLDKIIICSKDKEKAKVAIEKLSAKLPKDLF